jgi:hypothetical protein
LKPVSSKIESYTAYRVFVFGRHAGLDPASGTLNSLKKLDSGFRRNDDLMLSNCYSHASRVAAAGGQGELI